MNSPNCRVAVVGAGPLGSAAARHLVEAGAEVTIFGPREPSDFANHNGTWAGHYDEGRIAATDPLMVATLLGKRAMDRYAEIEESSGITFSRPHPQLMMFPDPGADVTLNSHRRASRAYRQVEALLANSRDFAAMPEVLGPEQLQERFRGLSLPDGQIGVLQGDAIIVNPRKLVAAELALAERAGARRNEATVTALSEGTSEVVLLTDSGDEHVYDEVLLAVGSATNASGLLSRPVATEVYGATIVLLEVAGPESVDMPSLMYLDQHHGGGLITPPTLYPDGRWYLKCASGQLLENVLHDVESMASWVRTGGARTELDYFLGHVAHVVPDLEILSARTWPCIPSTNITNVPYIDRVGERTTLLVEGERGVMMADEIGRLGSELCLTGEWLDPMPHDLVRVRWVGQG